MWRIKFIEITIILFSAIFLSRLFYWQIIKGENLKATAEKEHFNVFEIPARRGEILANDSYALVANKTKFLLYASLPSINESKEKISEKLAKIIINHKNLDKFDIEEGSTGGLLVKKEIPQDATLVQAKLKNEIYGKISSPNLVWVSLADKIDNETKTEIEKEKINGLGFEKEDKRFYPEGSSAAHLLGFLGVDNLGRDKGYFGLEGYYNKELRGRTGKLKQEKDVYGKPIPIGKDFEETAEDGRDLTLSLDRVAQNLIEKRLSEGAKTWGAPGGSVTVINPENGSIIAMASFPSYEPEFWQNYGQAIFKNPVISDVYEPGSIMKPLIMAAAINENKIKPDSKCPSCGGPREIGGFTIRTFNNQYHPQTTMTQVLENSDNTGMIFVGEKLGLEKVYSYLEKYGFGKKANIDLEGEEEGNLRPKKDWREIDLATATFGQGIAVTQIQMLKGFGAIANGGFLITPHVASKTSDNKKTYQVNFKKGDRILKEETAIALKDMLVSVTERSPLHFPRDLHPELKNYRIAAKSGTAQIPISGHYDSNKTIGSVIGFVPAEKPKLLIYVRLIEPSVRPWGSDTAGPIFFNIVDDLLKYYGIPPRG